jgi:predicted deacylase
MAAGKPSIVVELVSWRQIDHEGVEAGVRGTLNVLKRLGMIGGAEEPQSGVATLSGRLTRTEAMATKGGLVHFMKALTDPVRQGEVIALIRNPHGDIVEEITSPVDGWVLAFPMMRNQAAATGDFVAFLATDRGGVA